MSDIEKWIKIVESNQVDDQSVDQDKSRLDEGVMFDFNNGYYTRHQVAHWDDYFPNGAENPVVRTAGPASAKQGDNPMQKDMMTDVYRNAEVEEVYENLVSRYGLHKKV